MRHQNQQPITARRVATVRLASSYSWWAQVKPGESMTACAIREQERMNRSREARAISSLPEQMNYLKTNVE